MGIPPEFDVPVGPVSEGLRPPLKRAQGPLLTKVFFRWVHNADIAEEVRVVGDCPELGDWNPATGVVLTAAEEIPCWVTLNAVALPSGKPIEYKYVIVNKVTGEIASWEDRQANRYVVPTGRKHVLEDDGGRIRRAQYQKEAQAMTRPRRLPAGGATGSTEESKKGGLQARPRVLSGGLDESLQARPRVLSGGLDEKNPHMHPSSSSSAFALPGLGDANIELTHTDQVVMVFRVLPMGVEKDEATGAWAVNKNMSDHQVLSFLKHFTRRDVGEHYNFQLKFIGHPGVHVDTEEERKAIKEALAPHHCVPVFVSEKVWEQHLAFSHLFLWPICHNMKIFSTSNTEFLHPFNELDWKSYQHVNKAFADVILANCATPETLIWVQDYMLFLVPKYLRLQRLSDEYAVAFFMHEPFPSCEAFRCMPVREEILQSLLQCKVVTFQVFDYTRNFLNCCGDLLETTHSFQRGGVLQVEYENRSIVVGANHFVLPYKHLSRRLDHDELKSYAAQLREQLTGKTVIGCIDRCDRFSGLILKLRAFHCFLKEYRGYQNKVVLLQFCELETRNNDNVELFDECQRMADEINKCFGKPGEPLPVMLSCEDLSRDIRLAVLQATDILLDTSINDGLNLVPFMFYAAHTQDQKGLAIVSEFSGCSSALTGAFQVNPWNTRAVMETLDEALSLPAAKSSARFSKDHSYVSSQSLLHWVTLNLIELKSVKCFRSLPVVGLDTGMRMLRMDKGFRNLNIDAVLKDYRKAKTRAIFLDVEGTLAPNHKKLVRPVNSVTTTPSQGLGPDAAILDCIQTLARDKKNTVVVLSGRETSHLDSWFESVEGIGLCAEHGFYCVLPPGLQAKATALSDGSRDKGRWKCWRGGAGDSGMPDDDWKLVVLELFKQYVKRVQGSVIAFKGSSVTWSFKEVGSVQLARQYALELTRFLNPEDPGSPLRGLPVKVVSGKGYVEVKRNDVDKGVAVSRVLQEMRKQFPSSTAEIPEFVLCIGDDRSDEDMFEAIDELFQRRGGEIFSEDSISCPLSPSGLSSGPFRPPRRTVGFEQSSDTSSDCVSRSNSGSLLPNEEIADALPISSPFLPSNPSLAERRMTAPAKLVKKASITVEDFNKIDVSDRSGFYTVTVGRKISAAKHFVKDEQEVGELLKKLGQASITSQFNRFSSMPAFTVMEESDEEVEQEGQIISQMTSIT